MSDDAKRCDGCKHWNTERVYDRGVFKGDKKDPVCELIAARFVASGDGDGEVYTPADFGCVLWETKT